MDFGTSQNDTRPDKSTNPRSGSGSARPQVKFSTDNILNLDYIKKMLILGRERIQSKTSSLSQVKKEIMKYVDDVNFGERRIQNPDFGRLMETAVLGPILKLMVEIELTEQAEVLPIWGVHLYGADAEQNELCQLIASTVKYDSLASSANDELRGARERLEAEGVNSVKLAGFGVTDGQRYRAKLYFEQKVKRLRELAQSRQEWAKKLLSSSKLETEIDHLVLILKTPKSPDVIEINSGVFASLQIRPPVMLVVEASIQPLEAPSKICQATRIAISVTQTKSVREEILRAFSHKAYQVRFDRSQLTVDVPVQPIVVLNNTKGVDRSEVDQAIAGTWARLHLGRVREFACTAPRHIRKDGSVFPVILADLVDVHASELKEKKASDQASKSGACRKSQDVNFQLKTPGSIQGPTKHSSGEPSSQSPHNPPQPIEGRGQVHSPLPASSKESADHEKKAG